MNSAKNNSYKTEEQQLKSMIINELILTVFAISFGWRVALLIIGGLLFFALFLYFGYLAIMNIQKAQDKARLMEEKILPELFSKFGKVISIEAVFKKRIQFERNGTVFDLKVTPSPDVGLATVIQFSLPNFHEKFYIQHKSFFSPYALDYCQLVKVMMSDDFVFYSLNPQFLVNLIAKHHIRDEIYKYQKKFCHKFEVVCDNGAFTITWNRFQSDKGEDSSDPKNETRKLEQICQTAFVFCDELTKTTT